MSFHLDQAAVAAYFEVIMINILLSGDNVIVIAMAAAGLANDLRGKAIATGIAAAAVIRIVFAVAAVKVLAITGIRLIGGLLLLWICWTMLEELRVTDDDGPSSANDDGNALPFKPKMFRQAIFQIVLADVSMSLDNVLAVAGASKENVHALIFGLILSVVLMGLASSFVAKLLNKHKWIGWLGLAIIVYVAVDMTFQGGHELLDGMHIL